MSPLDDTLLAQVAKAGTEDVDRAERALGAEVVLQMNDRLVVDTIGDDVGIELRVREPGVFYYAE